jgi:hypothetical protein
VKPGEISRMSSLRTRRVALRRSDRSIRLWSTPLTTPLITAPTITPSKPKIAAVMLAISRSRPARYPPHCPTRYSVASSSGPGFQRHDRAVWSLLTIIDQQTWSRIVPTLVSRRDRNSCPAPTGNPAAHAGRVPSRLARVKDLRDSLTGDIGARMEPTMSHAGLFRRARK